METKSNFENCAKKRKKRKKSWGFSKSYVLGSK